MFYRRLVGVALAFVAACAAFSAVAAPWAHDWRIAGPLELGDLPKVAADPAGGLVIGSEAARFASVDAAGGSRWTAVGSGPLYGGTWEGRTHGVVADADGSAWFTVSSDYEEASDTVLTRVDATGAVAWTRPVSGGSLVRVADGVVVAGCGWYYGAIATKFDLAGNLVWQRALGSGGCRKIALATVDGASVYAVQAHDQQWIARLTVTRLAADGRALATAEHAVASYFVKMFATAEAIYVGAGGRTLALAPDGLALRWEAGDCWPGDVVPATAANGANDVWCAGTQGVQRRTPAGAVRVAVPLAQGEGNLLTQMRAFDDGVVLIGERSARRLDPSSGQAVWTRALLADDVAGIAAVGVSQPHAGRIGVVTSSCDPYVTHCTASVRRLALADGALVQDLDVDGVALPSNGVVERDGDDVGMVAHTGGASAALHVRILASSDGTPRWDAAHTIDGGRRIHHVALAFGDGFVAAAAAWSTSEFAFATAEQAGTDIAIFDRATGALRRSVRLREDSEVMTGSPSLIAFGDKLVLGNDVTVNDPWFGTYDFGVMRRIAIDTGDVVWRTTGSGSGAAQFVGGDVVADLVVTPAPAGSRSVRLAASDGHVVWHTAAPFVPWKDAFAVLPGGDFVMAGFTNPSNSATAQITRVNFATGAIAWQRAYGDGVKRHGTPYVTLRGNGEVWVAGTNYAAPDYHRKPYLVRIASADGALLPTAAPVLPAGAWGLYWSPRTSGDGRTWAVESRRIGSLGVAAGTWLVEFDAAGQPIGRQSLRLYAFSDLLRMHAGSLLDAPGGDEVLVAGTVRGGGSGDGVSVARQSVAVTDTGDLALTLDATPVLKPGKQGVYRATVTYDGAVATRATLFLQLPWPDAGPTPVCGASSGECTVDERNGWLMVRFRILPGATVNVSGSFVARQLGAAYDGYTGTPLLQAIVAGETGLREPQIDNNVATRAVVVSLFASGFD